VRKAHWLTKEAILAIHDRLLAEHGGSGGIRDHGLLEAALARPQNLLAYGKPSRFELAAAYACGIIKSHPFIDGNKRTGFMAAFVFLGINKIEFAGSETEVVMKTLGLAANEMSEEDYAAWLKVNSRLRRSRKRS
jgi:death on curing protein